MGCGCFFAKGSAESHSQARQAQRCRAVRHRTRGRAGWRYAYPAYGVLSQAQTSQARPAQRHRAGHLWRHTRLVPGGGWRLTRPTLLRPVVNLFTIVAETAGADGLKIAETFPEGRGSPHGCGLRAVFCMDAASARPEACRDKSKGPRSGDFAGRSPGVQGAAATGRPLCAPCAMPGITQKINRERKFH